MELEPGAAADRDAAGLADVLLVHLFKECPSLLQAGHGFLSVKHLSAG